MNPSINTDHPSHGNQVVTTGMPDISGIPPISPIALLRSENGGKKAIAQYLPALPVLILVFLGIILSACDIRPDKSRLIYEIEELENEIAVLYRETGRSELTISKGITLRDAYLRYADTWSRDSLAAEYLFQAAMIDADIRDNVANGIQYLERIVHDYPEHPIRSKTLFLVGFTYAEQLNDYARARDAYQMYLDDYPDGEMAGSVRIEIETLGIRPDTAFGPDSSSVNMPGTEELP